MFRHNSTVLTLNTIETVWLVSDPSREWRLWRCHELKGRGGSEAKHFDVDF